MMHTLTELEARERNLTLKMAQFYLSNETSLTLDTLYSIGFINKKSFFNTPETACLIHNFFRPKQNHYTLKDDKKCRIKDIIEKYKSFYELYPKAKDEYIDLYTKFNSAYKSHKTEFSFYEQYPLFYEKIKQHVKILHYVALPEYSEEILINRGFLPEDNIDEFYNHYYTLQDLYSFITQQSQK